jgi:hypothetical protein
MGYKYPWIGALIFYAAYIVTAPDLTQASVLRLNWQDTSSSELGFKIERLKGSTYVEIASVAANVSSYTDSDLTAGSTYCYRVRAFRNSGVSAPSNAACTTAPVGSTSTPGSSPTSPNPTPTPTPGAPAGHHQAGNQWSDYFVSVKMRSADNDAFGVMFRYQDAQNYYRFSWFAQDKIRRLEKRVNGEFHVLAEDAMGYTAGQTYAVQITARDAALTVAVDGRTIFSVADTSLSQGTIGLYTYYNLGSYFEDVRVQDLLTGNTLLSDDFADGDYVGWTIIDEGAHEGPSLWSVANGALAQTSNLGSPGGDNGRFGTYALYTRGSWSDYRLALTLRSSDDDLLGVMFRVQDSQNYYGLTWQRATPGRRLWKREKGVFKLLAQDAVAYTPNHDHAIEILAQGHALKVNIDGKAVFSLADESFAAGAIALYSAYNQGSFFDDIRVENLATKTMLLSENFNDGNLAGWKVFDEPGAQQGPSKWSVANGAVVQNSNIGSEVAGSPGTFLLY